MISQQVYLIDKLIPSRQTNFLSGSSGAGKTTWLGWFINQLRTQERLWDYKINRPPFIAYIAADRDASGALAKLVAAGWTEPAYYDLVNDPEAESCVAALGDERSNVRFPLFYRALAHLRRKYLGGEKLPPDSLLAIDGMGPLLGIEPAGKYLKSVARTMLLTNMLAAREKFLPLLMHHGIKVNGENRYLRPEDNILGSMALQGFSSTMIHVTEPELSEDPSREITTVTIRSHDAPRMTQEFKRDPNTGLFVYEGPSKPALDISGASQVIYEFVPVGGYIVVADLLRLAMSRKVGKSNFYKCVDKLVELGQLARSEDKKMLCRLMEDHDEKPHLLQH